MANKKVKKRIDLLQAKRQNLRNQLSTVTKFPDDPTEAPRIAAEIAAIEAELAELKQQK